MCLQSRSLSKSGIKVNNSINTPLKTSFSVWKRLVLRTNVIRTLTNRLSLGPWRTMLRQLSHVSHFYRTCVACTFPRLGTTIIIIRVGCLPMGCLRMASRPGAKIYGMLSVFESFQSNQHQVMGWHNVVYLMTWVCSTKLKRFLKKSLPPHQKGVKLMNEWMNEQLYFKCVVCSRRLHVAYESGTPSSQGFLFPTPDQSRSPKLTRTVIS